MPGYTAKRWPPSDPAPGSTRSIQDGWTNHATHGNPTGASGRHATAAGPPLEAMGPIDEGDDGFTSGGTTSTDRLRRLDVASAPSAPQSRPHIRRIAAQRNPTPSLSQWRSELSRPDGGRAELASCVGARGEWNGEADLRRTICLATPPSVGRRLIQRLVPHALSKMAGRTTPPTEILPGHQGGTPPRLARHSRPWGRLTRATTDSHREARPARIASGASILHQPFRPLRAS